MVNLVHLILSVIRRKGGRDRMLIRKDWHDFKKGELLLWELLGTITVVEVKGVGPNYISCVYARDPAKNPTVFRLWEKDLANLSRIKTKE